MKVLMTTKIFFYSGGWGLQKVVSWYPLGNRINKEVTRKYDYAISIFYLFILGPKNETVLDRRVSLI